MIIGDFNFNIYMMFILLGIFSSVVYSSIYMFKDKIRKVIIIMSIVLVLYASIGGGLILSILEQIIKGTDEFQIGLSSYGGCIGLILGLLYLEKITKENNLKGRYIVSIPLIYSISKLGCFFAGCCYGIPYNGFMSVTYTSGLNIPLFPVQLVETISFFIIFIVLHFLYKKTKNIIEYTLISCSLIKFLLDFLRYSHIDVIISMNQIISILFFIVGIYLLISKKRKDKNNE